MNIDNDIWGAVVDYPPNLAAENAADDIKYVLKEMQLDDLKRHILSKAVEILEGINDERL